MELKENQKYHNTYFYEKEMMKYVQNGDIKRLKELLNSSQNLVEGIVAGNALRQKKNIFITIATLTTRAAIQGGMNLEEAYQLAMSISRIVSIHRISLILKISIIPC